MPGEIDDGGSRARGSEKGEAVESREPLLMIGHSGDHNIGDSIVEPAVNGSEVVGLAVELDHEGMMN